MRQQAGDGRRRRGALAAALSSWLILSAAVPGGVVRPASTAAAEPTPTLEVTWTRPGVPGTMQPPAALRVGDTVTITFDTSEYDYAMCEVSFRHAVNQREMWAFFRPQSQIGAPPCEPWTFTLPPSVLGLIEVRGVVYGNPIDGNGGVSLMTPLVEVTVEAGGTAIPYTSNYPVPSWAPIDLVGDPAPRFNTPLTIRKPPLATTCSYTINGGQQTSLGAAPEPGEPCADWNVTLPDIRPAIQATGPFAAPWDAWLIVRGMSLDVFPGVEVGGVATTEQLFWEGTGDETFESDLPSAALLDSRTPHFVLAGETIVLAPEVRAVTGDGVCQYSLIGPTTTDDGIIVQRPFTDGVCEPMAFEASLEGVYQFGVGIRTYDWLAGASHGAYAFPPMPAPSIDVEDPEAGVAFDVSSSLSQGAPATYEFDLGVPGSIAGRTAATDGGTTGLAAAGTCTSGTLDYQAGDRTASGRCTAPQVGIYDLTASFRDVTGAARTRAVTVYVIPRGAAGDIGGSPFENDIRWLYASKISGGCSPNAFCPNRAVTREQMASFLVRALGLPTTSRDYFADDEGSIHENDINRLAASGITGGCTAGRFCPTSSVTRQQMASFLARALNLPPASRDYFTDDEGSVHERDINRLAASRITGGCSGSAFCPRSPVTREQMAAFLRRALER